MTRRRVISVTVAIRAENDAGGNNGGDNGGTAAVRPVRLELTLART